MNRNPLILASGLLLSLFTLYSSHFAFAQWTEQSPRLRASDGADLSRFGESVAVSGNVAVVGASWHPSGGNERGQAYVYRHNGTTWAQEQILQTSVEMDFSYFGASVAVSGNIIVVGAGHPSDGLAYVFRYNGSVWVQEQILQASDEEDWAYFGNSVSVSGNVIAIGARGQDSGGGDRGHAYVFRYNGATWLEEQILQASDEVDSAYFGCSVAVSGNVVVVGAYNHHSGGLSRGQAYVFRYNGATWPEEQILQASDEVDDAYFGICVAVSADVIAVGASWHSSGGIDRGQAYLYRYNGATWPEEQILQASDEMNFARFCDAVTVSGDVVVVGAYNHPSGGSNRGQAYLFRYNGATWPEEQILQASDEADAASFGYSVAVSGNTAVVGAYLHPAGGNWRGQAYTFGPTPNAAWNWTSYE